MFKRIVNYLKFELATWKGHELQRDQLAVMYNNEANTDLGTLGVDLELDYGYKVNKLSIFDKGLTGNNLYAIM